jgi:hypothetical protein
MPILPDIHITLGNHEEQSSLISERCIQDDHEACPGAYPGGIWGPPGRQCDCECHHRPLAYVMP